MVLHVAHRAGNDPGTLQAAAAAGADLAEADVHLRRGRLELRHAKSAGPLPVLWEPWHLVPPTGLVLGDLAPHLQARTPLLLDLKGWQPWLGRRVRDAMAVLAPQVPYAVCSRTWRVLTAFSALPHVRVVHSARRQHELTRLHRHVERSPGWGVALHAGLVTASTVDRLHARGRVVLCWPVDTRRERDRLVGLGVDGLIADDLGALQD